MYLFDLLASPAPIATTDVALGGAAIAVLGAATLVGYYAGGLAQRLKLPSVIGYMVVGIAIGPSILNILWSHGSKPGIVHMSAVEFIPQVALGLVAFSIGSELNVRSLKKLGIGIISIILGSSFLAFILVALGVYAYSWITGEPSWGLALVFGAMAPATAPAGTVAVILEYRAKGTLTQALYAVVGFDDGLAIIIYGFAIAFARIALLQQAPDVEQGFLESLKGPIFEIMFSLIIGAVIGYLFCFLVQRLSKAPDIFLLLFGTVLLATGLSELHLSLFGTDFHGSLILTNMVIGFVMCNTRKEAFVKRVTSPLLTVMPLIFVLFFCLAGAHLELGKLPKLGMLGLIYILMRSAGKIFGANLGAMVGTLEEKIKKWCGVAILAQAGVAIGLSLIVNADFQILAKEHNIQNVHQYHDPLWIGATLLTTITASCVIFEIIGPILAKLALTRAGEINKG